MLSQCRAVRSGRARFSSALSPLLLSLHSFNFLAALRQQRCTRRSHFPITGQPADPLALLVRGVGAVRVLWCWPVGRRRSRGWSHGHDWWSLVGKGSSSAGAVWLCEILTSGRECHQIILMNELDFLFVWEGYCPMKGCTKVEWNTTSMSR